MPASRSHPTRTLLLLGLALVACLGGAWALLPDRSAPTPAREPILPAVAEGSIEAPPPRLERRVAQLGRGGTIAGTLDELGVAAPGAWVSAIDAVHDVRRLRAEARVAAFFSDETAQRLLLRHASDRWVEVERDATGELRAELHDAPRRTQVETAVGRVENSVSGALADLPWGASLTHAFADVFQWDINLLVDPRPGDELKIVYELERLDELPTDLPAFGNRSDELGRVLGIGRLFAARYEGSIASSSAFWIEDDEGAGNYYDEAGQPLRKAFLKSPLNYRRISSGFSRARKHPVTGKVRPHYGVDFAAPRGTPVAATADGRISHVGWLGGAGKTVKVRHGSQYETLYGHLSRYAKGMKPGKQVRQGDIIGFVGSTGLATGPHLHYTLYITGRPVDPLKFKSPSVDPLPDSLQPSLIASVYRWDDVMSRLVAPIAVADAGLSANNR